MKSGFVNFWRNGYVSLASILVMVVTLFIVGSLMFTGAVLTSSLDQIRSKVDVNVYFVTTAQETDILSLKRSIESLPEVALVEYVSREQALENFRERHENDALTLQALDELGTNPSGAVLNIKAKDPSNYESIATFLDSSAALSESGRPIIDKVNYYQNKAAIDKLNSILASAQSLGFALSLVFAVISVLIIFNTVSLAIYNSREEIGVMRLVGAGNHYIRGPFIVEGAMYGLISALIVLVLFYPLTYWLGPTTENFFSGLNLFKYYLDNFPQVFSVILGSGIVLGMISSFLAVRKHLKV